MNKKLPFEDALENKLQQLPKPAEEISWQAMSLLLDKNDNRKLPPPVKKYFIFLLLVLLLLSGIWALLRKNEVTKEMKVDKNKYDAALVSQNLKINRGNIKDDKSKNDNTITESKSILTLTDGPENKIEPGMIFPTETKRIKKEDQNKNEVVTTPQDIKNNSSSRRDAKDRNSNNNFILKNTTKGKPDYPSSVFNGNKKMQSLNDDSGSNVDVKKLSAVKGTRRINMYGSSPGKNNPGTTTANDKKDILAQEKFGNNKKKLYNKGKMNLKTSGDAEEGKKDENVVVDQQSAIADKNPAANINIPAVMDDGLTNDSSAVFIKPVITATLLKDSTNDSTKNKTGKIAKTTLQQKKSKHLVWSAGTGLQQQIPMGNQKSTSYGFNANKNIIDDYIPSVYLRLEKPGKWFTQLEFSYASPGMVSEFPYSRKTKVNNISKQISTTTTLLKKMYYHKMPLSFNYYLKPGWSIGAGIVYGKLYRVISEQQLTIKNTQTQQEETTSKIIPAGYTDSFFYKSQWSWMLQSNFQWRRFGFGIRYCMATQPYIKFTKPTGEMDERKNGSLEFLLRLSILKAGK